MGLTDVMMYPIRDPGQRAELVESMHRAFVQGASERAVLSRTLSLRIPNADVVGLILSFPWSDNAPGKAWALEKGTNINLF